MAQMPPCLVAVPVRSVVPVAARPALGLATALLALLIAFTPTIAAAQAPGAPPWSAPTARMSTASRGMTSAQPGRLVALNNRLLRRTVTQAPQAGTFRVRLLPTRRGTVQLRRKGRLATHARVRYIPRGGTQRTKTRRVVLALRR